MNPLRSRATMGSLPRRRTNAMAASKVAADVVRPRTTSTSGMSGTGLKKWRPMNRSDRPVAVASSVIERLEVFEAKIVPGGQRPSSSCQSAALEGGVLGDRLDDQLASAECRGARWSR